MEHVQGMHKTPEIIRAHKNKKYPLVCLTAYSAPMAQLLDPYCDILLVGDSMGTALYGMENTLGVTLDMIIQHGKAVTRKAVKACVIVDMPYGTYENGSDQALQTARRIITETSCDAVKLEGGTEMAATIAHLNKHSIPVMAHIGLKPQSVVREGGYKVKGKTPEEVQALLADAHAVEKAGAFGIVIEGTLEAVAGKITHSVSIPTIGIGASACCDGQILVTEDMLGITQDHIPKFVHKFVDLGEIIEQAVSSYAKEVHNRTFPRLDNTYQGKTKISG